MSKYLSFAALLIALPASLHAQPQAKAWISVLSAGTLDTSHSFNSSGATNVVTRIRTGTYAVLYPTIGAGSGGMVHVTSGNPLTRCKAEAYRPSGADLLSEIHCRDLTGADTDSNFTALYYRESRLGERWYDAYFLSDLSVPPNGYTPPANFSWNSRGTAISLTRNAVGSYTATLPGFWPLPNLGLMLVTAFGTGNTYCNSSGWGGAPDLKLQISCFRSDGAPGDSQFLVSFFTDVAIGSNVASDQTTGAYALANDPSANTYTPSPSRSLISSGGIIGAVRQATGTYAMNFGKLQVMHSTIAMVTADSGSHTCAGLDPFTGPDSGATIPVTCVNPSGTATDANYSILYLATPPPAQLAIRSRHAIDFFQGQQGATYTLRAGNTGGGPTLGAVSVTEVVPDGMRLVSMSGIGWTCAGNACSRSDVLLPTAAYPIITAAVDISPTASSPLSPFTAITGGGSLPTAADDSTVIAGCSFQLSSLVANVSDSAHLGAFAITVDPACGWTAVSDKSFVTITSNPSFGSGNVTFAVAPNLVPSARAATITVGTATFVVNQAAPAAATSSGALRFVPVPPCRIADTRDVSAPILTAAAARDFSIAAGPCGIPTGAAAYSLNVTVVPPASLGFLSLYPAGSPQPTVSTLNSLDGRIKANAAIVAAGVNGAITLFASDATHAIIDVNGYFVPANGANDLAFYPVAPCRLADTRGAEGTFGGPVLLAATTRRFPVPAGPCGIPASAQAYALNLTVVPSGPLGFLTAWPQGQPIPDTSTLNALTGAITSNMAIVPAGTGGGVSVIATHNTQLIIDISGYFAPPGPGSLDFFTTTPCRMVDTRDPQEIFGGPAVPSKVVRSFPVGLFPCNVPPAAQAYSMNVTVVPPAAEGFITVWGGGVRPGVATLTALDGSIVANAAIVPGSNGLINVFATDSTHLIIDINGYFR